MNKYIASLLVAGSAMLLGSCDMNLEPAGTLTDKEVETVQDFSGFRIGCYNNLRGLTRGGYVALTAIQADNFQAIAPMYGNNNGPLFAGNLYSNDEDVETIWGGLYGAIANCNFFLPLAEAALQDEALDEDDKWTIRRYIAEVRATRAYYYYYLMDHWCDTPNATNLAKTNNGVPLVTEYAPTPDRSKYPGRCNLQELVTFIDGEIDYAYNELKAYEEYTGGADPLAQNADNAQLIRAGANYLNSLVMMAFKNRMQLLEGKYAEAITTANAIIEEGANYGIALGAWRTFSRIWTADTGSEIIFMPYLDMNEAATVGSTGGYFTNPNQREARYIPASPTLSMYESDDERFYTYFTRYSLPLEGQMVPTYVLNKYPGNSNLNQPGGALINMSKPFRLAEQYLIIAEAAAELGQTSVANEALTRLRTARYSRKPATANYSGQELIDQVRLERNRELLAEGFRISDLRRWGLGFSRSNATVQPYYSPLWEQKFFVTGASTLTYMPGDHRLVWPIPMAEIEVNPQIKGQQNPGY